jgi:hypothetical protein
VIRIATGALVALGLAVILGTNTLSADDTSDLRPPADRLSPLPLKAVTLSDTFRRADRVDTFTRLGRGGQSTHQHPCNREREASRVRHHAPRPILSQRAEPTRKRSKGPAAHRD